MYFDDFKLHTVTEIVPVAISKERMTAFAREYDPLPIHMDEEYAKSTRFGALIAPGVMTFMSIWAEYIRLDLFGDELVAGKSTKIEWHRPVYAGDVLTAQAEITALTRRNAGNGIVEVTVTALNQHGVHVLTDVTEIVVRCRPQTEDR